MKYQLLIVLLVLISGCNLFPTIQSPNSCFNISAYPDFRIGERVDTSLVPFDLMPYETNDELYRDILSYSQAYFCFGFDGMISSLLFTLDSSDQKLNSLMVMWSITTDPKDFMNRLRETYLPCLPVKRILKHPNVTIQYGGGPIPEFFKYTQNHEGGMDALHYWVGI